MAPQSGILVQGMHGSAAASPHVNGRAPYPGAGGLASPPRSSTLSVAAAGPHQQATPAVSAVTLQRQLHDLLNEVRNVSPLLDQPASSPRTSGQALATHLQANWNGRANATCASPIRSTENSKSQQGLEPIFAVVQQLEGHLKELAVEVARQANRIAALEADDTPMRKVIQSLQNQQDQLLRMMLQQLEQPNLTGQASLLTIEEPEPLLKELREERIEVANMLTNVRQEKLEVIALMHGVQVNKDIALQELAKCQMQAMETLEPFVLRGNAGKSTSSVLHSTTAESTVLRDEAWNDDAAAIDAATIEAWKVQAGTLPTQAEPWNQQQQQGIQQLQVHSPVSTPSVPSAGFSQNSTSPFIQPRQLSSAAGSISINAGHAKAATGMQNPIQSSSASGTQGRAASPHQGLSSAGGCIAVHAASIGRTASPVLGLRSTINAQGMASAASPTPLLSASPLQQQQRRVSWHKTQ